jgi:hypothetical protein
MRKLAGIVSSAYDCQVFQAQNLLSDLVTNRHFDEDQMAWLTTLKSAVFSVSQLNS